MLGRKTCEVDSIAIGRRIRKLRQARNLNQDELASLCDLSTSLIGHIERGEKSLSLGTAIALSRLFGISLDALVLGRAEKVCDRTECPLYEEIEKVMKRYEGHR